MRAAIFDEDSREIVRVLLKLISNLLLNPGIPKFREIKTTNKVISRLLVMYPDTLDYLLLVGFEFAGQPKGAVILLDPSSENKSTVETALQVLKSFAKDIGLAQKDIPTVSIWRQYRLPCCLV